MLFCLLLSASVHLMLSFLCVCVIELEKINGRILKANLSWAWESQLGVKFCQLIASF